MTAIQISGWAYDIGCFSITSQHRYLGLGGVAFSISIEGTGACMEFVSALECCQGNERSSFHPQDLALTLHSIDPAGWEPPVFYGRVRNGGRLPDSVARQETNISQLFWYPRFRFIPRLI